MPTQDTITLTRAAADFGRIEELLDLILRAFASMDGVIDPPSSAHRLTPQSLRDKCAAEIAIVALRGERPVGCVFLAERADHVYLGKLAVDPACQGKGLGGLLMREAETVAIAAGKPLIELQTRVELTANQATFAKLGFVETGRSSLLCLARNAEVEHIDTQLSQSAWKARKP